MEGTRIEDFDLDALLERFGRAERRAFVEGRMEDASDLLIAAHLVCVVRGDYLDGNQEPEDHSLRLVG
jgi:hypothetical protein